MNKNIRELAWKAEEWCREHLKDAPGPVVWAWEDKFAELIIDKCVELCNDAGDDVENGDIFRNNKQLQQDIASKHIGSVAWYASDKIKEYFKEEKEIEYLIVVDGICRRVFHQDFNHSLELANCDVVIDITNRKVIKNKCGTP